MPKMFSNYLSHFKFLAFISILGIYNLMTNDKYNHLKKIAKKCLYSNSIK